MHEELRVCVGRGSGGARDASGVGEQDVYVRARLCPRAYMHIRGRGEHWVAMVTSTTRAQEAKATGSGRANQRPDTHHAILRPINAFFAPSKAEVVLPTPAPPPLTVYRCIVIGRCIEDTAHSGVLYRRR